MKQILHYFNIIRPLNVLISGVTVFIAGYLLDYQIQNQLILIISLIVMSFCSFANIINDLFDIETDKINNPQKNFINLKFNQYQTLIILIIFSITPLILAHIYFPNKALYYLYIILLLIIIYTPYLKGIPLIGNITISFIISSVFIITELVLYNSISKILFYPTLLTFLLTLIREIIKDVDDLKGDLNAGINTFPTVYGIENSKYLLLILTIQLIILSIYPYYIRLYDFTYLFFLILLVQIPLIWCIFYLWKYPDFQNHRVLTNTTKYITIGGVITILSTKLLG